MMHVQQRALAGRTDVGARAFTLVEMMVVVIIVGVIAMLGVIVLRRHIQDAHTIEALSTIQGIRAAEERWRAENLTYLDVSKNSAWYPRDPSAGNGKQKVPFFVAVGAHADAANWLLLNPTNPGDVMGGYLVNANSNLDNKVMTAPKISVPDLTWPTPPEAWYVIQAIMDSDGDGDPAFYLASSLNGEVYRQNEGE